MATDHNMQRLGRRLVEAEIRYCVSQVVSALIQSAFQEGALIDEDDAMTLGRREPDADDYRDQCPTHGRTGAPEYVVREVEGEGWQWAKGPYDGKTYDPEIDGEDAPEWSAAFDTELEAWKDAFEENNADSPEGAEIYEHWLVSDWLARRLRDEGESIADDVLGLTIWGRACTGQSISMDHVIQKIALETYGEDGAE